MHESSTAPIPVTTEAAIPLATVTVTAVTIRDTASDSTGKEVHVCCIIHNIHVGCYLAIEL